MRRWTAPAPARYHVPVPAGAASAGAAAPQAVHEAGATPKPGLSRLGNQAVQRSIAAARSDPGAPLEGAARAQLPPGFGPVDDLRVHTGPGAVAATAALGTQAFAVGRDLFFARGAFEPGTAAGRRLLSHEVAHGIQQRRAASNAPPAAGTAEAERDADHAVATGSAPRLQAAGVQVMASPDPPVRTRAGQLYDEYMAISGKWYERLDHSAEFGDRLLGLIDAGEIVLVTDVFNLLAANPDVGAAERRVMSTRIVHEIRLEKLDELAGNEAGRTLLAAISDPLQWGWQRLRALVRVEDALARARGHEAAQQTLAQAGQEVDLMAQPEVLKPLDVADVGPGLARVRLMLARLRERYEADIEIGPALVQAETDLEARFALKQGQEIDLEDDARQLGAASAIVSRFGEAMGKFDRMLPAPGAAADGDPLTLHYLQIIGGVRHDWITALDQALMPEGPRLLSIAEARSAALPDALVQLYLGSVPEHGRHFTYLGQSVAGMVAWVRWTQAKMAALRQEAGDPPSGTPADDEARDQRRRRDAQLIAYSLEGIRLWDRAIRGHEEVSLGVSPIGHVAPHVMATYASLGRLRTRCEAMKTAALAEDVETLAALARRNREDPDIEQFFHNLPGFIASANLLPGLVLQILIQFTVLKVASMAASAAGGLVSAGEGASLLNVSAQVALESLVFTGTSRVMNAALGQPSKDSFLFDLAMNVGLFGMLRVSGAAVRSAMVSRGLEEYAGVATHVSSFALLQVHGVLHFAISQQRWPSAKEIGDLSVDGLIMYGALVATHRPPAVRPKPHSGLAVLEMLHGKFGERLASVETAKTRLAARIYEQMRAEQAADPALQQQLQAQAAALESSLAQVLAQVKADPLFDAAKLRETLQDPALQSAATSSELLAESFGVPAAAELTPAGETQYSYAPGATEVVAQALEAKNAVVTDVVDAAGQHTLVAEVPGEPPIFLSERAGPPETRTPKRIYVPSAPVPAPPPTPTRTRSMPKGEVFAPEGGVTKQGATVVRRAAGNTDLTIDQANLKAGGDPNVHEALVKEHFRRSINRGEIPGRLVSGHKMNIRGYAEAIPERAADPPSLDEATRDFIDRPENSTLRNELVDRLIRLRNALRMPAAELSDATIAGDPWDASARLQAKAEAAQAPAMLRRAADDYVAMFSRSIGDLQPDMMIVDPRSVKVIDATHTVGTQFEVFHEFKTRLYMRIIEQLTGLPVTGLEFRSPREQRSL
ncbi:eCIS core domain-containing protein [Ramlibacter sp. AN1133]|uniref:eCIS core domain-containing protein n=1 Tax=Ramlibacter sp. AN1133 TaxID=3133429 RepID=UPI0030BB04CD